MTGKLLGFVVAVAVVLAGGFLLVGGTAHAGGICVSQDGAIVLERGGGPNKPTCITTDGGVGTNTAIAVGTGEAQAGIGDDNTATSVGRGNAFAGMGDDNAATAVGSGEAEAGQGNGNTATSVGSGAAIADDGVDGAATSRGACFVEAELGSTDECRGGAD